MTRTTPLLVATAALSASACLPALGQMLPWPGQAMPELPSLLYSFYDDLIGAVAGDLDGDGREDIVFGTSYLGPGLHNIILMYSRTDGFEIVEFPATGLHMRMAIGDFDGDGRQDVAARAYGGEITVYFQQSGGSFVPSPIFQIGGSLGEYSSLLAQDLDGDGRSELIVVDFFYFLNDPYEEYTIATLSWGAADAQPTVLYSSESYNGPAEGSRARALIDWDGDGALDLVGAGRTVAVALASGVDDRSAFGPWTEVRPSMTDVEYYLADANGDGVDDILTIYTESDESFVELLGASTGVTIPAPHLRDPLPSFYREPLKRGGFPGPGGEQMIRGLEGYGQLSIVPVLPSDEERVSSFIVLTTTYDRAVAADVDGDERDDLIFYSRQGKFPPVLYLASDTASTTTRYRSEVMPNGDGNLHVTDLNGDGTLDIVSSGHYTMRDEAGNVIEVRNGTVNGPYFEGDFDGDGFTDIGFRYGVRIDLNPGGPLGTQSSVELATGTPRPEWAIGADMTGDGVDEIVVSVDRFIRIYRLEQGEPVLLSELRGEAERIFKDDVNRDGHPDIVGVDGGRLIVWINNGIGGLLPEWIVAEDFGFGSSFSSSAGSIAMGDIDGDGYNDFVGIRSSASSEGTARIIWGGPGGFSPVQSVDFDRRILLVRIADVDGDGLSELIASQGLFESYDAYAGLVILKQTSPRQFEGRTDIVGGITQSFEFRDMNSDGVMDAVINSDDQPTRIIYGATVPPAPCPADINADGQANFADLIAYLGLFNAGDAGADLADPIGVVNFTDFVAYLAAFNAGCP